MEGGKPPFRMVVSHILPVALKQHSICFLNWHRKNPHNLCSVTDVISGQSLRAESGEAVLPLGR